MLNKNKQRELAYVTKVLEIKPIPGKDRVEAVRVNGWWIMCKKGDFKVGDPAIYFEVDSQVPSIEAFEFLRNKKYHIKTQKYKAGEDYFYSQGLLMTGESFGWKREKVGFYDGKNFHEMDNIENMFVTDVLDVVHYQPDNFEKKCGTAPMTPRDRCLRNIGPAMGRFPLRQIAKTEIGKNIIYFIGKHFIKCESTKFPTHMQWVVPTDQERCENNPSILDKNTTWVKTQKCDGTSCTYILERKKGIFNHNKYEYYVCSRNVRQLSRDTKNYHTKVNGLESNFYWELNDKYNIYQVLKKYMDNHPETPYITLQGEGCGPKIQKNPHHLKNNHLFVFHIIDHNGRWTMNEVEKFCIQNKLEHVPIIDWDYRLPKDMETLKRFADGYYDSSCCENQNGIRREGFVYYDNNDPSCSYKNVSREYLAKKG